MPQVLDSNYIVRGNDSKKYILCTVLYKTRLQEKKCHVIAVKCAFLMWLQTSWLRTASRAWIAQTVEHQTFNLRVQGSSPCSGALFMLARICRCLQLYVALQNDVAVTLQRTMLAAA